MTEEDARQRWCPFVRVSGAGEGLAAEWHNNRPTFGDVEAKGFDLCIASACMAWRWSQKRNPDWNPSTAQMSWSHPADNPPAFIRDETQGGCGLAGAPS